MMFRVSPQGSAAAPDPFLHVGNRLGMSIPLIMVGVFSAGWASGAYFIWNTVGTLVWAVISLVAIIFFLVTGIRSLRHIQLWRKAHLADKPTAAAEARSRSARKAFGVLFGTEAIAMTAVIIVCNAVGFQYGIIPLMVIAMGVHFIPFAPLFHRQIDYVLGGVAIIVGTLGLVGVIAEWGDPQLISSLTAAGASVCTVAYGFFFLSRLSHPDAQLSR